MAFREVASVSRDVAVVAALALLCGALALLLWERGLRAQRRATAQRFVERRVAAPGVVPASKDGGVSAFAGTRAVSGHAAAPALGAAPMHGGGAAVSGMQGERPARRPHWPQMVEHLAARAGLDGLGKMLALGLAAAALGILWIGAHAGVVAACAAVIAVAAVAALLVTARSQRRRLAIVRQIPTFLDGIVRLVTLGNSVPAAFQAALQTTEAPLRECLDHVSRMMRAGVEIDRALAHVATVYRTREFEFVGAVLLLSVKYGGRADVMLERMSAFMRDLEQAERELSAMSAETRLSAWVLIALPLLIGGALIATNPRYFEAMLGDADGRRLIYLSFSLQAAGGYLLYRMTKLRA